MDSILTLIREIYATDGAWWMLVTLVIVTLVLSSAIIMILRTLQKGGVKVSGIGWSIEIAQAIRDAVMYPFRKKRTKPAHTNKCHLNCPLIMDIHRLVNLVISSITSVTVKNHHDRLKQKMVVAEQLLHNLEMSTNTKFRCWLAVFKPRLSQNRVAATVKLHGLLLACLRYNALTELRGFFIRENFSEIPDNQWTFKKTHLINTLHGSTQRCFESYFPAMSMPFTAIEYLSFAYDELNTDRYNTAMSILENARGIDAEINRDIAKLNTDMKDSIYEILAGKEKPFSNKSVIR